MRGKEQVAMVFFNFFFFLHISDLNSMFIYIYIMKTEMNTESIGKK